MPRPSRLLHGAEIQQENLTAKHPLLLLRISPGIHRATRVRGLSARSGPPGGARVRRSGHAPRPEAQARLPGQTRAREPARASSDPRRGVPKGSGVAGRGPEELPEEEEEEVIRHESPGCLSALQVAGRQPATPSRQAPPLWLSPRLQSRQLPAAAYQTLEDKNGGAGANDP